MMARGLELFGDQVGVGSWWPRGFTGLAAKRVEVFGGQEVGGGWWPRGWRWWPAQRSVAVGGQEFGGGGWPRGGVLPLVLWLSAVDAEEAYGVPQVSGRAGRLVTLIVPPPMPD